MAVQLLPLHGGQTYSLTKDITLVGRKEGCDLRLDHKSVSKQHCILVKVQGLLIIRDLGSTNGTRVNGKRVRRAALTANDQLSVAGYSFRVLLGATPAPAVSINCLTQHIDPDEVSDLNARLAAANHPDATPPIQVNALPDTYTPPAHEDEE